MGPPNGLLSLVLVAGSLTFAGCSNQGAEDNETGGTSDVSCGGQGEVFTAGMSKLGTDGTITFIIASADPAPPERYANTWTIELEEGDTLLEGATVTVSASMPGHPHQPAKVDVTEPVPGRYEVTPIDLFMIGLWNVTIVATSTEGSTDSATFAFCI